MKTGYTVKQILDTDIDDLRKLSGQELKNVVATLRDAAAKRYKRAIEKDELDPAITAFRDKYHGRISVKGRSDSELRKELQKGYYFLNAKTSTSTGRAQVKAALEKATGEELTRKQIDRLWKTMDKLGELFELGQLKEYSSIGSPKLRNWVASQVKEGHTVDYILKHAEENLKKYYEAHVND